MEINTIKVDSYPSSEKVYLKGSLFPINVGMRKINLTPNVHYEGNTRIETPNEPVLVYDTSGTPTQIRKSTSTKASLAFAKNGLQIEAMLMNSTT